MKITKGGKSQNRQYNGQTKRDNDINHRTDDTMAKQDNGQYNDVNHRTDNAMAKQNRTMI